MNGVTRMYKYRRLLSRTCAYLKRADEAAGSIIGVMLVMVVCSLLALAATAGYVIGQKNRTQSVATVAALSAMRMIEHLEDDQACAMAQTVVLANNATLDSCVATDDEVKVRVSMSLAIPLVTKVSYEATAGFADCSPEDADNLGI